MGYHCSTLLRFVTYALPLLVLLLALFGFAVELLDAEPRAGSVIRLALFEQPRVPALLVLGAWLVEASGLLALFLLAQGRCGAWWLDGLVTGWLAWIFRGPLLVMTIVVAVRQPHHPWWALAFGWWVLYSVCGLTLAWLARRVGLSAPKEKIDEGDEAGQDERAASTEPPAADSEPESDFEPFDPMDDGQAGEPIPTSPGTEELSAIEPPVTDGGGLGQEAASTTGAVREEAPHSDLENVEPSLEEEEARHEQPRQGETS